MAATKRNAMNIAEARQKIQTTQLVKRLTDHVLGLVDMQPSQVTAALGLLKKALPDLTSTELNVEGEIRHAVVSDKPLTEEEWIERYSAGSVATASGSAKSTH